MEDRLYCGVRLGLLLGDELLDLVVLLGRGLPQGLLHGLLDTVGVVLLVVSTDTSERDGEGGPLLGAHAFPSCRFTIDAVCCRLNT